MEFTASVVENEPVGPDTVALTFESPAEFEAAPGQFVKLTATVDGEEHSRFYTLSSPDTDGTFEVTVEVSEEGGPFGDLLVSLSSGDEVDVDGPYGRDFYEGEESVVVLAGGPGVGPAVAIAEAAVDDGHDAAVVYRYDGAPAHETRLESLGERAGVILVDDGGLAEAVSDALAGREGEQVFVYGFAEFVEAATDALESAGRTAGDAKVESFG